MTKVKIAITHYDNFTIISSKDIEFSNYQGMYEGGRDGIGIQHNTNHSDQLLIDKCNDIVDAIVELNKLLNDVNN